MSVIEEVLRANNAYAKTFGLGHLPMPPARKLAIVACMDGRLTVEQVLGLKTGMRTSSATLGASSRGIPCARS